MATGFKYHAITHDKLHDKWIYDQPEGGENRAASTPCTFAPTASARPAISPEEMDRPPMIVSPYDAELYGHWWFEGIQFLDDMFRQIHFKPVRDRDDHRGRSTSTATPRTSSRCRARRPGARRLQ